jgi:PAS domain S-box-containing protein
VVGGSQGTFEARSVDGPMVIFAFRSIDDTPGWMAVTGEPLSIYNARWRDPLYVLLILSVVTVVVALMLATLVTRRILRPIKHLAQQARLVVERGSSLEAASFSDAPSVVAEFDMLRESLVMAKEQTRRSHAALQSSYEALRQAERVARVGSWSLDLATKRFECSEMMCALNGADPNGPPLTSEDLPRLVTPESLAQVNAAIARCLKTGEPYRLKVDCLRLGGGQFAGYLRGEAVRDENGEIVGLRGTLQDISELEEERRRIAALADNLPNGAIFRVEELSDGRWLVNYMSAGIKEITGLSAEEIMPDGAALINAILDEDRPAYMYLVVYGLRNQGLTEHIARLLDYFAQGGVWGAAFGTGFLTALLSSAMNNMPTVLVGALSIDATSATGVVKDAMIYANVIGSDLGPKITPIGSLATLLWLHVLARKGMTITWGYYFKVGVVLTVPVLAATLAALALRLSLT